MKIYKEVIKDFFDKKIVNNRFKYILKNRRIFVVLVGILIIAITIMPTLAFFTGKGDWSSLNSRLNDLTINNGNVNFDVDYSEAVWRNSVDMVMTSYSNPNTDDTLTYGPVWVQQLGDYKLTSKFDLLTQYQIDKVGGSEEVLNKGRDEIEHGSIQEPFEVIVGDIDNFGYTEKGDPYLDASAKHSKDVFPGNYDARGTDRRMVGSGFYNALYTYNNNITYGFNHSVWYDLNGNGHDGMNTNGVFYGYKAPNSYEYTDTTDSDGEKKTNNYFLYDGYTDWAIRGVYDSNSEAKDCVIDNKNWKWLQVVEPITFKYDNITKDIKTVIFQVFTDDIQSGDATDGYIASFQKMSGSVFHVYLNGTEIPEFTYQINRYAQSGPKGNIINLELPSKSEYFDIIKDAAGLNGEGLKLLINDTNGMNKKDYYTGDSFAIDFAKMTVNAPATGSADDKYYGSIAGKITDIYNKEIEGATIVAETGESVTTDSSGNFKFDKLYRGLNKFTVTKDGYKKSIVYFNTGESNANIVMEYSDIVMQEKCQVEVIITKCNLMGEELKDDDGNLIKQVKRSMDLNDSSYYIRKSGTIIEQAFTMDFQPDCKYKIEYRVKLRSHDDLKDKQDFNLNFTVNSIKVKATQENNPGWTVAGTGDKYVDNYNNLEYNKTFPNDSEDGADEEEKKNTTIHFEAPDTGYFGTIENVDFILNNTILDATVGTKKTMYDDKWWIFDFNDYNKIISNANDNKGSKIQVKNSKIADADSGELYWFTTQKIFICTN